MVSIIFLSIVQPVLQDQKVGLLNLKIFSKPGTSYIIAADATEGSTAIIKSDLEALLK